MVQRIAVTGAGGILGYHLRVAAKASGFETVPIPLGGKFDRAQAKKAVNGAAKVVHLAGVNLGSDSELTDGNVGMAKQLASVLEEVTSPPSEVIYSNSIQADHDTVYGNAKRRAGEVLSATSESIGIRYLGVKLPNLFGEFGRPFQNGVVATFSHLIANDQEPKILHDKELQLLHLQNAADVLLGAMSPDEIADLSHWETVTGVKQLLQRFARDYSKANFPEISNVFQRDLFSTYLSQIAPRNVGIDLNSQIERHDMPLSREHVKHPHGIHSIFVTEPGATRGNHNDRRKVKQITVLTGQAEILLRKMFDKEFIRFRVSSDVPHRIDVPALYEHKIINVGVENLYTDIWTDGLSEANSTHVIYERT